MFLSSLKKIMKIYYLKASFLPLRPNHNMNLSADCLCPVANTKIVAPTQVETPFSEKCLPAPAMTRRSLDIEQETQ